MKKIVALSLLAFSSLGNAVCTKSDLVGTWDFYIENQRYETNFMTNANQSTSFVETWNDVDPALDQSVLQGSDFINITSYVNCKLSAAFVTQSTTSTISNAVRLEAVVSRSKDAMAGIILLQDNTTIPVTAVKK